MPYKFRFFGGMADGAEAISLDHLITNGAFPSNIFVRCATEEEKLKWGEACGYGLAASLSAMPYSHCYILVDSNDEGAEYYYEGVFETDFMKYENAVEEKIWLR